MSTSIGEVADLTGDQPTERALGVADIEDLVGELAAYHAHFAPLFTRYEQRRWAEVYLRGLLTADVPRKNVEAMALRLFGAGPEAARTVRALQQFVGEGGWDDARLLAAHRRLVDETLGEDDGVLIVDGSDFPKQGGHSAGVARQWCGHTGKKDNCQAGVFLGYASREGYTLLDRRLYLPEGWFTPEAATRWKACRIPADTPFRTKHELAAELVEAARAAGTLRARWMACDEGYGDDPALLDRVAATGLWYLAEVPRDTQVWPLVEPDGETERARPERWVPPRTPSRKGPAPRRERLRPGGPAKGPLDQYAARIPPDRWRRYRVLEGSKGPLVADFVALRAVAVRDKLPGPEVWVLLRRKADPASADPELKVYLSNAPAATPLAELVRVSGMRWPIEAGFAEGNGELGMDNYELRFWRGWHHHMTLVILAHHFLARLQRRLEAREGGRKAAGPGLARRADPVSRLPEPAGPRPAAQGPEPRRDGAFAAHGPASPDLRSRRGVGLTRLPPPAARGGLLLASQTQPQTPGGTPGVTSLAANPCIPYPNHLSL